MPNIVCCVHMRLWKRLAHKMFIVHSCGARRYHEKYPARMWLWIPICALYIVCVCAHAVVYICSCICEIFCYCCSRCCKFRSISILTAAYSCLSHSLILCHASKFYTFFICKFTFEFVHFIYSMYSVHITMAMYVILWSHNVMDFNQYHFTFFNIMLSHIINGSCY